MKCFKMIAWLLVLALIFTSLVGCNVKNTDMLESESSTVVNSNDATDIEKQKDDFIKYISKFIDISHYNEPYESDKSISIRLNENQEKDYELDYKIDFSDSSSITLPTDYNELVTSGWKTVASYNENTEIKGNENNALIYGCDFENLVGETFHASFLNATNKTVKLSECPIYAVKIETYVYNGNEGEKPRKARENAPQFTVCGSITNQSKLEDIIKVLGEPTKISFGIIDEGYNIMTVSYTQKSDFLNSIEFDFWFDENVIQEVRYNYSLGYY